MLNQFSNSFFATATVVVHNSSAGADIASRLFSFCSVALNLVVIISFISLVLVVFFSACRQSAKSFGNLHPLCRIVAINIIFGGWWKACAANAAAVVAVADAGCLSCVYGFAVEEEECKETSDPFESFDGIQKKNGKCWRAECQHTHTHYSDLIGDDFTRYRKTTNLHP